MSLVPQASVERSLRYATCDMGFTISDLRASALAAIAFAPLLLTPGYLCLLCLPARSGRRRTPPETLLWSLLLSLPLSLFLCAIVGRWISPAGLAWIFGLIAAVAVAFFLSHHRHRADLAAARASLFQPLTPLLLVLAGLLLFATVGIEHAGHLFEGVHAADWSVRVPLVAAAVRDGVPPGNPFFAVAAHEQPGRFYFYWYSLCAVVARFTHLPPRACLAGSVVWSAFALIGLLILSLRNLLDLRLQLSRRATLAFGLCFVMGPDIVPAVAFLFTHPVHLTPEIEWWHADRIPSFFGAFIFAPHHIAGLCCAVLAFLLLAELQPDGSAPPGRLRLAVTSILVAICFAATAGTSTYIAFCFGVIGALYAMDLIRHRQWLTLAALVSGALLALAISAPFLHSLLSGAALPAPSSPSAHQHFFRFTLRELADGDRAVIYVSKHLHHRVTNRPLLHLLALPFVAIYLPLELGFFLFPFAIRLTRDLHRLRSHQSLTSGERLLWLIFLGAALPALFLSSDPTQGVNDLGRHAGLILRFVLVVWSTPLVAEYLDRLRSDQPLAPRHPWAARLALFFLVLGLASQLWQIVIDRSFLAIMHRSRLNPESPFAQDTNLGGRYLDLRRGLQFVESRLPAGAVVQSNPGSRYQPIVMLYSDHPFAAGDISCEAAFGGDLRLCRPMVLELEHLFGGPPDVQDVPREPYHTVIATDAPTTTTPAAFKQTCSDLHLAALVAQNSDPAWGLPESWVWKEKPVYATPIIRIFACPAAPLRASSPS